MVPGVGKTPATLMFVAEAPGEMEVKYNTTLCAKGRSGALFNKLLSEAGWTRDEVYTTNVYKFRPPKNRTPHKAEIKEHLPFLHEEVWKVQPQVIVGVGRVAIDVFCKGLSLKAEHGKARVIEWDGKEYTFVPWYHPAAALRNPSLLMTLVKDAQRLKEEIAKVGSSEEKSYELVDEEEAVSRLLGMYGEVGHDVESTSPTRGDVFQTGEAEIVGASWSTDKHTGFYVSTGREVNPGILGVIESPLWTKVVAGGKFEYKAWKKQGVELNGFEDVQIAAALCGEESVSLKVMGRQILGDDPQRIQEIWTGEPPEGFEGWERLSPKRRMERATWQQAREVYERAYEYGCTDADNTLQLWQYFKGQLDDLGLWWLYDQVEKPLVKVLAEMELEGVDFDRRRGEELLDELESILWGLSVGVQTHLAGWFGDGVLTNTNSRPQKSRVLEAVGWEGERTETGLVKTSEEALLANRDVWPEVVDSFIQLDKYEKLRGFVKKWLELVNPVTNRIHGSINQSGGNWDNSSAEVRNAPATGRLSMSGPNLNQVPHHSDEEWGRRLRELFVAENGWLFVAADAEQEEPRTVAVVAHDEELINAFTAGTDIYRRATCALYPHTDLPELPDSEWKVRFEHERFNGKTFFLAWYYGAGPGTLVKHVDTNLDIEVARAAVRNLAKAHPAREVYLGTVEEEVLGNDGWVVDMFGRKRFVSKMLTGKTVGKRPNPVYSEGLREAANFKVQGPCSTILKMAMLKVDKGIREQGLRSRMLFPVHDELVGKCPEGERDVFGHTIQDGFRNPFVTLPISVKYGRSWGDVA